MVRVSRKVGDLSAESLNPNPHFESAEPLGEMLFVESLAPYSNELQVH